MHSSNEVSGAIWFGNVVVESRFAKTGCLNTFVSVAEIEYDGRLRSVLKALGLRCLVPGLNFQNRHWVGID